MNNMSLKPISMDDFFLEVPGFSSPEVCAKILDKYSKYSHMTEPYPEQHSRSSKLLEELDLFPDLWSDILSEIEPSIKEQIKKYLARFLTCTPEYYKFSHATLREYSSNLTEDIHYNTEYAIDHGSNIPIRNFFCLLYLNKPSQGGEQVFPLQSKVIAPDEGKLLIYPTSFMFPNMSLPCYGSSKLLIRFNYHLDIKEKSIDENYKT